MATCSPWDGSRLIGATDPQELRSVDAIGPVPCGQIGYRMSPPRGHASTCTARQGLMRERGYGFPARFRLTGPCLEATS